MKSLHIINLAIESSLKAKVTITGAFDDATASYFGGVTVTDNGARKILIKEPMEELPVLVYMPNFISKSGSSDLSTDTTWNLVKTIISSEFMSIGMFNYFLVRIVTNLGIFRD